MTATVITLVYIHFGSFVALATDLEMKNSVWARRLNRHDRLVVACTVGVFAPVAVPALFVYCLYGAIVYLWKEVSWQLVKSYV